MIGRILMCAVKYAVGSETRRALEEAICRVSGRILMCAWIIYFSAIPVICKLLVKHAFVMEVQRDVC